MSHQFYTADDTRAQCEVCDVIVDLDVADGLLLACPTESCAEPANHGEPCVFLTGEYGPECAYCARFGDPEAALDALE